MAMPAGFHLAVAGILGAVVGSFLNVVIYRVPLMHGVARQEAAINLDVRGNETWVREQVNLFFPHSACPKCGHELTALENVPIFSYLALRGKCRACHTTIGLRYLMIELAGVGMAVVCAVQFGYTTRALAGVVLIGTLIVLAMMSADEGVLPDLVTMPLLLAGLIVNLGGTFVPIDDAVVGAAMGYMVPLLIFLPRRLIKRLGWLGFSEVKLLAGLGGWVGYRFFPEILFLTVCTSLGLTLAFAVSDRESLIGKSRIFVPSIAAAGVVTVLFPFSPHLWP